MYSSKSFTAYFRKQNVQPRATLNINPLEHYNPVSRLMNNRKNRVYKENLVEVSNIYYREETVSVHKKSNNELNFSSLKKKMPIYCQQVDYGKAKRVLEEKYMDRHEKTVKVDSAQKRSSSKFFDMVCSNRSGKKIIVDKSIHEESKTSVIKQLQFDSEDKSLGRLMDTKYNSAFSRTKYRETSRTLSRGDSKDTMNFGKILRDFRYKNQQRQAKQSATIEQITSHKTIQSALNNTEMVNTSISSVMAELDMTPTLHK